MQLADYLSQHPISDDDFARKLGLPVRTFRNWKYRDRTPPAAMMVRIEELTKGAVTVRDWAAPAAPKRPRSPAPTSGATA